MKKILAIASACVIAASMMCGCNRQVFDMTYKYDRAIVQLPNGEVVEGKVSSWRDYDNSDQIQIVIDGTTYLVHSSNVVLVSY